MASWRLPTGSSLADFTVGVTLGTGSFGRVRIATHNVRRARRDRSRARPAPAVGSCPTSRGNPPPPSMCHDASERRQRATARACLPAPRREPVPTRRHTHRARRPIATRRSPPSPSPPASPLRPPPTLPPQSAGTVWAIKQLKKAEVIRLQQVEHMLSEKRILDGLDHPFIVKLGTSFQDSKCVPGSRTCPRCLTHALAHRVDLVPPPPRAAANHTSPFAVPTRATPTRVPPSLIRA